MFIVHIFLLVIGLILSIAHIGLILNTLGIGAGIGGSMATVVLAGVLQKFLYVDILFVLLLGFFTFHTDHVLHPYTFWLSIAILLILVISPIVFFLTA